MAVTLAWKDKSKKTINSGTVEQTYVIPDDQNQKAIIGLGFAVDDSNLKRMTVTLRDVNTGETSTESVGDPGQSIEWECVLNAEGLVLTGIGLNAGERTMYPGYLYAQKVEATASSTGYLGTLLGRFQNDSVDKEESRYVPPIGNSKIIVGLEVGVRKGDIAALYLWQATLATS
jgi:hypothetical protein